MKIDEPLCFSLEQRKQFASKLFQRAKRLLILVLTFDWSSESSVFGWANGCHIRPLPTLGDRQALKGPRCDYYSLFSPTYRGSRAYSWSDLVCTRAIYWHTSRYEKRRGRKHFSPCLCVIASGGQDRRNWSRRSNPMPFRPDRWCQCFRRRDCKSSAVQSKRLATNRCLLDSLFLKYKGKLGREDETHEALRRG